MRRFVSVVTGCIRASNSFPGLFFLRVDLALSSCRTVGNIESLIPVPCHQQSKAAILRWPNTALGAIARKVIDRKTGARGLRSIMEGILLDTMFDLPSLEGVEGVVISKEVVEGTARPLYIIYADRADRAGDASAS
jgi:hypothetical protein